MAMATAMALLVGCAGTASVEPRRPPAPSGALAFPLVHAAGCSRGFDARARHFALDLATDGGTPVLAAAAGVVVRAAPHPDYGRMVVLDHGDGLYTLYAHLRAVAVALGQRVGTGAVLGAVGHTGNASGDHLHWEVLRAPAPLAIRPTGALGIAGDDFRVDPAREAPCSCAPATVR